MTVDHPRHQLDRALTQPIRLSILAAASREGVAAVEFKILASALQISDSLLSQHVSALEAAGYVAVEKGRTARYSRTWIRATDRGRTALGEHMQALQDIIKFVPEGEQPT
ncbi:MULTISPECIES: transcriptional regulator [Nocardiaceae]|uniref:transcriptional regulator n=1 Tax=Nocardiaceae TaxID=85025 RepID=UPI00050BF2EC|nr:MULTISPECIES: transcriptional regulator [Rhodococcus]